MIKVQGSSSTTDTIPTSWLALLAFEALFSGVLLVAGGFRSGFRLSLKKGKAESSSLLGYLVIAVFLVQIMFVMMQKSNFVMAHLTAKASLWPSISILGRLIRSQMEGKTEPVLQLYNVQNRLSGQNYYIGGVDFTESYTYNNHEGNLIIQRSTRMPLMGPPEPRARRKFRRSAIRCPPGPQFISTAMTPVGILPVTARKTTP